MLKKILLLSLYSICFIGLFAQEKSIDTEIRNYFDFKEGETVYLFGDNVNIRASPSVNAKVLETVPVNTPVTILTVLPEDTNPYLTLNGITAPWVKIQFGTKQTDGFIWAPLIAQYQIPTPHYTYLFGVTKMEEGQLYAQLRAVKYGRLWEKKDFPVIGSIHHYTYGKIYGNRGLTEVDAILELGFGYDACGYTSGHLTFIINKDAIDYLGKSTNASDAGIVYNNTEFIFPNNEEAGQPHRILKKVETGDFDEIGNGTITTKISVWQWQADKLIRAKTAGPIGTN